MVLTCMHRISQDTFEIEILSSRDTTYTKNEVERNFPTWSSNAKLVTRDTSVYMRVVKKDNPSLHYIKDELLYLVVKKQNISCNILRRGNL